MMIADNSQDLDHNFLRRAERQFTWVELRPFSHQVGGHTCVFEVNPSLICKPYTEREVVFYETHPDELKRFIPSFQGMIQVKCERDSGALQFSGHVPATVNKPDPCEQSKGDNYSCGNNTFNTSNVAMGLDSWSLSCLDRQINKYGFWTEKTSETFIMLNNLVADYEFPCILDIKLGTRQYGDDSSLEKRKLLQDRCKNSTSSSLGLRICGMQVYKMDEGRFVKFDKYHGRSLDVHGVKKTLRQFFHNGHRLRNDMRLATLEKLEDLISVLENETSFLFFSCSLLMLYDGKDTSGHSCSVASADQEVLPNMVSTDKVDSKFRKHSVDIRIIDFAHTVKRDQALPMDTNAEEGIVFGLKSLVKLLAKIS